MGNEGCQKNQDEKELLDVTGHSVLPTNIIRIVPTSAST